MFRQNLSYSLFSSNIDTRDCEWGRHNEPGNEGSPMFRLPGKRQHPNHEWLFGMKIFDLPIRPIMIDFPKWVILGI